MNLKKSFCVLSLLLVLMAMSAVSAEDVNTNVNSTAQSQNGGDEVSLVADGSGEDVVSVATDDSSLLGENGATNFTSLQEKLDNPEAPGVSSISLDGNVKHEDGESDITVSTKTVVFDGKGYTIDADNQAGIFVVKKGTTFSLSNVVLTNANNGAIYAEENTTVILNNVTFTDNAGSLAGAIYSSGTFTITGSKFIRNAATENTGAAAIYQNGGDLLQISGSDFDNNGNGLATIVTTTSTKISNSNFHGNKNVIYSEADPNLKLAIDSSVFDGNTGEGSLIDVINKYEISSTDFTNNKAGDSILVAHGANTGTLTGCLFENNSAENGAFNAVQTQATVDTCKFINNTASANGGAISVNSALVDDSVLTIRNSEFVNNTATNYGGAIYNKGTVNLYSSKFDNNTSTKGQIYNEGILNYAIENFTDLQAAVNVIKGNITLISDVTMTDDEASNFADGVSITKDTVIIGNGYTIDANNAGRIFNVPQNIALTLTNVTLANGKAGKGGAIINKGTLTLTNTTLVNNTATVYGGAIYSTGKNVEIIDSTFSNNSATYDGGAIFNGKEMSIDSCSFVNNTAGGSGGAICNAIYSTISIVDTKFDNNSAVASGGAISSGSNGAISIVGSNFTGNNVTGNKLGYGGAIDNSAVSASIEDCTFIGNGATTTGGAIYNLGKGTSIEDCTFIDNDADIYGGAIHNKANELTISGSEFENNSAAYDGGAIENSGDNLTIENSKFVNNTATRNGGAIDIYKGNNLTITETDFVNNSAVNGGAIYNWDGVNGSVNGSSFINNTATTAGGAIYNTADAVLNVSSTKFENNTSPKGQVYNDATLNYLIKTFTDLQSAINIVEGDLNLISDVAMTDDEADDFTDGIIINKNITINANGHIIDARQLGRIFNIAENCTLKLYNATLTNGKASYGGAIYVNKGSLTLDYVDVINGTGSAAVRIDRGYNVTIANSNFINNTGSDVGAIGTHMGANFTIENSTFVNNTATRNGGAIYNYDGTNFTIKNSLFENNSVNNNKNEIGGGAIGNTADGFTVVNSTFVNNSANSNKARGGAIWNKGSNVVVKDSTLANNSAGYMGGAIYNAGVKFTLENSTLENNTATSYGGAIFNYYGNDFKIIDSNFTNNSASDYGGAIENWYGDKFTIEGSTFENNTAEYGGAVENYGDNLAVTGSKFVNNTATVSGGAIDNYDGVNLTVSAEFINNTAKAGGAIFNNGVDGSIEKSSFINNTGSVAGGAIYNTKDAVLNVSGSEFKNNTSPKGQIYNEGILNFMITNFTELQAAIDVIYGKITLNQNVTMTDEEAAKFVNGVSIGRNVTIDGMGYTIDARQLGRIFSIGDYAVTLTNVTLTNGNNTKYGGAICNDGNLTLTDVIISNSNSEYGGAIASGAPSTLINVTFVNNTADLGGAIWNRYDENHYSNFTIVNSTFVNNTAIYGAGAIFNNAAGSVVIGSNFTNNTVTIDSGNYGGGAIYNGADYFAVSNSTFTNNTAHDIGGAIYNEGSHVVVDNSTFTGNTAANGGGAICQLVGSNLTISNSIFTDNNASFGGVIYNEGADSSVINSTFDDNKATGYGGAAIYNYMANNFTVSNSNFTGNKANNKENSGSGAAIFNFGGVNLSVSNSNFVNNSAYCYGGAIFTYGANASIEESNFTNNDASVSGGAVYNIGDNLTISSSAFENNTATSYGGAVYSNGNNLTVADSEFVNNTAYDGGAIENTGDNFTVEYSKFVDNHANHNGGAIDNDKGNLTITESDFVDNFAKVYGGAIYNKDNLTMKDSTLTNNTAKQDGGAIYNNNEAYIDNCKFVNNNATSGGAIHNGATIYIEESNFDNNTAENMGGAISNGNGGVMTIADSKFTNNTASNGGAIHTKNNMSIESSSFEDNNAHLGGAIYNLGANTAIEKSNFKNNTASVEGGAIYNTADNLTVTGSEFDDNTAYYGGAIYNEGNNITVSESEFVDNNASYGGAIYNEGSDLTVSTSTLSKNTADIGGAIYNKGSDLTVFNSTLSNNKAEGNDAYGGAIWNEVDGLNVTDSTFTENTANYGGAIVNNGGDDSFINNSTFTDNYATYDGAAIYNLANNLDVEDSTFKENTAGNAGAAILNTGNNLNVANSTFDTNTAVKGGAIYNTGEDAIISDSNFTNNKATGSEYPLGGGAIFNNGEDLSVTGSEFENNRANAGGAIFNNATGFNLADSIFTENTAVVGGGAVYNAGAKSVVNNATFTKNTVTGTPKNKGGAAIDNTGDNFVVGNSTFSENTAVDVAGAIRNEGNNVVIGNSTFTDNKADNGAAICNLVGTNLKIDNSTFTSNKATVSGGAIYIEGSYAIISNSTFTSNEATYGGAILNCNATGVQILDSTFTSNKATNGGVINNNNGTNLKIDNSTFTGNEATYGGVILNDAEGFTVSDSTFTKNTATGFGGVIYNYDGAKFTVENSTFDTNSAQYGGAIATTGSNFKLSNSTLSNNKATGYGGAIYNMGEDFTLDNTTFDVNNAVYYGGAIFNHADKFSIDNITFTKNTAVAGGAIFNNKGNFTATNSEFAGNDATAGVDIYNAENSYLDLNNNKYTVITGDKTNVYNVGTLSKAVITVLKNDTVNASYGDIVTLFANVTIDGASVAGKVLTFTVNGTQITAESLLNGNYTADYEIKIRGEHTVNATYNGVDVASMSVNTGLLNISKADPEINITVSDIYVDDLQIITVNINDDAEGLITLYINGTFNQTLPIYQGQVKFYLQNLTADKYEILVNYTGDDNYNNGTNSSNFTVFKRLANLTVDITNITYGNDGIILINLPSDITGTVYVYVNETDLYEVNVINGVGKLTLSDLGADKYPILVNYTGNYKYLNDTVEGILNVLPANPGFNVVIDSVVYGENSTVVVTLTGVNGTSLTGDVNVTIAGKNYTINVIKGIGVKEIKLGANDNYEFSAYWNGNDNYTNASFNGNFKVDKAIPTVDVDVYDIEVDDEEIVTITLPDDVTGDVTIKINDGDFEDVDSFINGVAIKTYKGLANGTYTVVVKYGGNENYTEVTSFEYEFTVSKVIPDMDIKVENLVYNGTQFITVLFSDDADGNVNITVNGTVYETTIGKDGIAYVNVSGLSAGSYKVTVDYSGNYKYTESTDETIMTIAKANPTLKVEIADVTYGNLSDVIVTLTGVNGADLNAVVGISINGTFYAVNVTNGKGNTSVKLGAANYDFIATWTGNDNYTNTSFNGNFKVNKAVPAVDVNVYNIYVGEDETVVIFLPADAAGDVTISIDDGDFVAVDTFTDGIATKLYEDLTNGTHTIVVKYSGNDNYNDVTTIKYSFKVSLNDANMNVISSDIIYGENAVVNVILPADAEGNVVIKVGDDVKYSGKADQGKFSQIIEGLAAGNYTVTVDFEGDSKYNNDSVNFELEVAKANAGLNVVINNVVYGDNSIITATLSGVNGTPLTGTVVVEINGTSYSIDVVNGTAVKEIRLGADNYTFTASWTGNANYTNASGNGKFKVAQAIPTIDINVEHIKVGEDETVTITLSKDINGEVLISIDDGDYETVSVKDGVAAKIYKGLGNGTHTVFVKYGGNDNYTDIADFESFEVSKLDLDMRVTVKDINFGGTETITVVLPEDVTENVTVSINGQTYNVTAVKGIATLDVPGLNAGNYSVVVKYAGDDKYTESINYTMINVAKVDPGLNVFINNVTYGSLSHVNVALSGVGALSGTVFITVDGKLYAVNVTDGKGTADIALPAGEYTLVAAWDGNLNYNNVSDTVKFSVAKANPSVDINVEHIKVGEDETVTINLPKDINGEVSISIDGKTYENVTVKDGVAAKTYEGLGNGTHTIVVKYGGNDNYTDVTTKEYSFTVSLNDAKMDVNVEDITYGENAVVNVILPADAAGNVVIKVGDDVKYNGKANQGKLSQIIKGLGAGNYTVTVDFEGDSKYNNDSVKFDLEVVKANAGLNVVINNVVYGDNSIITATLSGVEGTPLTGTVVVEINGTSYSIDVVNGTAVKEIRLGADNYTFTASWNGNANYTNASFNGNFKVAQAVPTVDVNVENINVDDIETVTIYLPEDINGKVLISIDDGIFNPVDVKDGVAVKTYEGLLAGNHTIFVRYDGNENYTGVESEKFIFNVAKLDAEIYGEAQDIVFGDIETITIELPDDADGSVNITVNGESYIVDIENGKAIKNISGLNAGTYNVTVKYSGNYKYNEFEGTTSFDVDRASSDLYVEIANVKVGETITIKATLTDINGIPLNGNVSVLINGKPYTVEVIDGVGNITGDAFDSAATVTFVAVYNGDDNYDGIYAIGLFKVSQVTDYNMTIDDIGVIKTTENATINVNVPKDATGNIIISIDNTTYAAAIENGVASLNVTGLTVGVHNIVATYDGNNKYGTNKANTTVIVSDAGYYMGIVVPDNVKYGENATIVVTLPADANGNVTVKVGNKTYKTVADNGSANITTDELGAGSFDVVATYDGDEKYSPNSAKSTLEVSKIDDYNMTVDIPDEVKPGENTTIKVDVPADATGNVTVTVDGKNYTVPVKNGTVNITIPALDTGVHNITTTYSGDDKYAPSANNGTIKVGLSNVNLTASDVVMLYHDGTRLTAVLLDINGNPIVNTTLTFAINGMKYDRTTDANGSASIALNLEYGVYNATVSYAGNDTYNSASVNATVEVISSVIGNDIVKMWRNGTQFFANFTDSQGNPLVNTTVRFNINGVFYNRETNENGTAKLTINLDPGNYTLTAYNPVTGEQRGFNVLVKSLIETADLTKYYLNESAFVVKVYNTDGTLVANKTVTFNINGVFYTRTSDANGIVKLSINLEPGDYIITSMYEGLSIGNKVKVLPTLETSDISMAYGDGSSFDVKTLDGQGNPLANQTITFNVNGVFYHRTTGDDGVAKLNINLMKGEYIITSYWNDYQVGNKISIS